MDHHHTVHVLAQNDIGALPRIMLAFARRRLRMKAVHFYDLVPGRPAELQVDLSCDPDIAAALAADLRLLDCVRDVHTEQLPARDGNGPVRQRNVA